MTELEYGINVANKFDLLFGDEDPSEALIRASQVDTKKKKAVGEKDSKAAAPGNVLKEKATRSTGKAPATGEVEKTKEKERKVEGKVEPKGNKKEGEDWAKPASRTSGTEQPKTRNPPVGGAQQQRPPRSAPQGGKPEQGKENTSDAQRRPQQPKPEGQQRSPAAAPGQQQQPSQQGGPRPFRGPRPEGSAPPRRPVPMEQEPAPNAGPMTGGDQEMPEQRTGFGGGRGFRGGSSLRGRSSPRHQYLGPRAEPGQDGNPVHARGREYERHSGSNKTGVKAMPKREGGGPYNWGSYRDEAEIGTEAVTANSVGAAPPPAPTEGGEAAPAETAPPAVEGQEAKEAAPAEEASKEPQVQEKTLKEWLEEEERNRVRPKFETRAANEGESEQKVFQKMRRVTRENADGMVEVEVEVEVEVDDDESHAQAGGSKGGRGGPFQLVFAPASRPPRGIGEGGPRGRGGRGGPRGGGGFGGRGAGPRPGNKQAAPPAQDELNFPPLG